MALLNRPVVISQNQSYGSLYIEVEDSPSEHCRVPSKCAVDFLMEAGLLWGIEDLAAGAEIVGYESAWEIAQKYAG